MINQLRTALLLAGITALFLVIGYFIGGTSGAVVALGVAFATNLFAYWNSDKIVLRMYHAQPVPAGSPVYQMVSRLAKNADIPMPKVYLVENRQPNAFATGRNPEHGAVAVTTGLLERLNEEEMAAVIAHELGHIKNRDTLIMTVTATLAGAIGALANFALFFGAAGRNREGNGIGPIVGLVMAILAPLAAMFVQLAISRTREYEADRQGAYISGNPLHLASALRKISQAAQVTDNEDAERNPATAHMFIVNPLHGRAIDSLFSTHPNPENRIRALQDMAREQGSFSVSPAAAPTPRSLGRSFIPRSRVKGPWA